MSASLELKRGHQDQYRNLNVKILSATELLSFMGIKRSVFNLRRGDRAEQLQMTGSVISDPGLKIDNAIL